MILYDHFWRYSHYKSLINQAFSGPYWEYVGSKSVFFFPNLATLFRLNCQNLGLLYSQHSPNTWLIRYTVYIVYNNRTILTCLSIRPAPGANSVWKSSITLRCSVPWISPKKINNVIIINKIGNSCKPEEVRWKGSNSHLIENSKEILQAAARNYQSQEWR